MKEEPCPTSTFDEALAGLGERLGHPFARPELLRTALTHRSFLNEHPDRPEQDNQRLEFLGDAVVQLVVSQELMARFPDDARFAAAAHRPGSPLLRAWLFGHSAWAPCRVA